jgi:beta-lactamase regulating signal transducer with metallopeptidase domain
MSLVHLHLLLNHVPIIGAVFVLLVLCLALWRRSSELGKLAVGMLVVIGVVASVVYVTGEPAEEAVENVAGVSEAIIHQHEDAAAIALMFAGSIGVMSLAALWWYGRRELPRAAMGIALAAVVALNGAMAWTAYLGGQIRHSEIRNGSVMQAEADEDH